jgi:hypothetical protein
MQGCLKELLSAELLKSFKMATTGQGQLILTISELPAVLHS